MRALSVGRAARGVMVVVLVGACLARPVAAAPAPGDLPDVKMPPLRADRPRLVFRPDGGKDDWTFARVKQLIKRDPRMRDIVQPWLDGAVDKDGPGANAMRYCLTGDDAAALRAIEQMQQRAYEEIGSEYYSNGWEYALAYDWLHDHPAITPEKRKVIVGFIVANLRRAVELLNDESWDLKPSLYHGRTKIANLAMVVALSLDPSPEVDALRAEAVRFFGDGCRALRLSEGWPEGYAYWLGNRSFPFAMAVDCWRTATGLTSVAGIDLIEMIRRTDQWHVFGMRPDNKLLLYGDVFQGVLIDYSLRAQTMDYYARLTGDPYLQAFALYGHAKAENPYYNRYRWVAAMAWDPQLPVPVGSTMENLLGGLASAPQAALFGAGAYNLAVFRTGWQPDDTLVSLRAGAVQVHHAHYTAGTFTIYKQAPLAILSGVYSGFSTEDGHRESYYIRSVGANCPLILQPGERLATTEHYTHGTLSTGGQRLVIPTGSDIGSSAEWRRASQPGQKLSAGRLIGFTYQKDVFGYVSVDLTDAYNSTNVAWPGQTPKVSRVVRSLIYLHDPETVLVYDRIKATSAEYTKKWLLHTVNKPESLHTKVLRGERDDGILETRDTDLRVSNGDGQMLVTALLPKASRWLMIGGPKHRFYVEADGDQADGFDGIIADKDLTERKERSYFDPGDWRMELESTVAETQQDFLVAMALGSGKDRPVRKASLVGQGEGYVVVQVGPTLVVITDGGRSDAVTVDVEPTRPVQRVLLTALAEPVDVPVDRFEPITPPHLASIVNLAEPHPVGKPLQFKVVRTADGKVRLGK